MINRYEVRRTASGWQWSIENDMGEVISGGTAQTHQEGLNHISDAIKQELGRVVKNMEECGCRTCLAMRTGIIIPDGVRLSGGERIRLTGPNEHYPNCFEIWNGLNQVILFRGPFPQFPI